MIRDHLYLQHILDAIQKIDLYIQVGREEFFGLSHWQDAVVRQLEIIGEASKGLSADLRAKHTDIPWRRICGLRDVLIHNYMGVDLNAVWEVTQTQLPILKIRIQAILQEQD